MNRKYVRRARLYAACYAVATVPLFGWLLSWPLVAVFAVVFGVFGWLTGRCSDPDWPATAAERARELEAEVSALTVLRPSGDDVLPHAKKDERVDPFDNVLDLLDRTAELPAPKPPSLIAAYRYRGARRKSTVDSGGA